MGEVREAREPIREPLIDVTEDRGLRGDARGEVMKKGETETILCYF